jgi:hypothetical protein
MNIFEFPYGVVAEWTCFLASIFLIRKENPSHWKLFRPYMAIIASIETFCLISRLSGFLLNNRMIYNCVFILSIFFHLYVFSAIIELRHIKKVITLLFITVMIFYLLDWYRKGFLNFFSTANTIFGGCLILLALLYYLSLFKQDEYKDLLKEPSFWFATGCLVFYATKSGINAFYEQLVILSARNTFSINYLISNILSIIMYSCWIKAFSCLKNQVYYRRSS